MATPRVCSVDGCGEPLGSGSGRGWCGTHYMRWYRTGDVSASVPIRSSGDYKYPLRVDEMSDVEVAWCAGVFEGEGWAGYHDDRHAKLHVGSCDRDVLERFVRYTDGAIERVNGPYESQGTNRPMYSIQYNGDQAIELSQALYPHLGARRQGQISRMIVYVSEADSNRPAA